MLEDQIRLGYWEKYGLPDELAGACRLDGALDWFYNPGARPADPAAFVTKYGTPATAEVVRMRGGLPLAWR